jgi:L-amino acid N-acyltransferase YncA
MLPYAIRPATLEDAEAVAAIYDHYVVHTSASFEEEPVAARVMAERMTKVLHADLPWLVAEDDGAVVGYAYATGWRERRAYRFSVECTVYVAAESHGRGVGATLYGDLFPALRGAGFHTVLAVVTLPNVASVRLHERFGLRKVAHLSEVGFKFGRWHDVGIWQSAL